MQLTAPALVAAWSPFKIIPALLLVFSTVNAKVTSSAFLAGSLASVAAITALFVAIPHAFDSIDFTGQMGAWASAVVANGVALILLAGFLWLARGRIQRPASWLSALTRISSISAVGLGTFLVVRIPRFWR